MSTVNQKSAADFHKINSLREQVKHNIRSGVISCLCPYISQGVTILENHLNVRFVADFTPDALPDVTLQFSQVQD